MIGNDINVLYPWTGIWYAVYQSILYHYNWNLKLN